MLTDRPEMTIAVYHGRETTTTMSRNDFFLMER